MSNSVIVNLTSLFKPKNYNAPFSLLILACQREKDSIPLVLVPFYWGHFTSTANSNTINNIFMSCCLFK